MLTIRTTMAAALLATLAACGGGGGGDEWDHGWDPGWTDPSATFALRSAYQDRMAVATQVNYTVTLGGGCDGWATEYASAPVWSAFDGYPALSKTTTASVDIPDCGGPVTATSQTYYDSAYSVLGSSADGEFAKFDLPLVLPEFVRVGDWGNLGTASSWTSPSRAVLLGSVAYSFAVDPDYDATAIFRLYTQAYDPAGTPLWTETDSYRLYSGTLVPLEVWVEYADGTSATMTVQ